MKRAKLTTAAAADAAEGPQTRSRTQNEQHQELIAAIREQTELTMKMHVTLQMMYVALKELIKSSEKSVERQDGMEESLLDINGLLEQRLTSPTPKLSRKASASSPLPVQPRLPQDESNSSSNHAGAVPLDFASLNKLP